MAPGGLDPGRLTGAPQASRATLVAHVEKNFTSNVSRRSGRLGADFRGEMEARRFFLTLA